MATIGTRIGFGLGWLAMRLRLGWVFDEAILSYWANTGSTLPEWMLPDPGPFRCPACQRRFVTARPVREALLAHLDECDAT